MKSGGRGFAMKKIIKHLLLLAAAALLMGCAGPQPKPVREDAAAPLTKATDYPAIVLYSVSWCPHCQAARKYLDERNIPYINRDVEQDAEAMDMLVNRYGSQSVPVIVIGNDDAVLKGFDQAKFEKVLQDMRKP